MSGGRQFFTFNQKSETNDAGDAILTPTERAALSDSENKHHIGRRSPGVSATFRSARLSPSLRSSRVSPSVRQHSPYSSLTVSPVSNKSGEDDTKENENTSPATFFCQENKPIETEKDLVSPSSTSRSRFGFFPKSTPRSDHCSKIQGPMCSVENIDCSKSKSDLTSGSCPLPGRLSSTVFRLDANNDLDGTGIVMETSEIKTFEQGGRGTANRKDAVCGDQQIEIGNLCLPERSTSELHELCQNASTVGDITKAQAILSARSDQMGVALNAASRTDRCGRTPMHLVSSNKQLSSALWKVSEFDIESRDYLRINRQQTSDQDEMLEKQVILFVGKDLLPANPGAMMIDDDDGYIPFEGALIEWVNLCHDRQTDKVRPDSALGQSAFAHVWESTSATVRTAVKLAGRHLNRTTSDRIDGYRSPQASSDIEGGDDFIKARAEDQERKSRQFPSNVKCTAHFRYAVVLLSAIVDQLDRYMTPGHVESDLRKRDNAGSLENDSFDRTIRELYAFRESYGSVNISGMVVQRGKWWPTHSYCQLLVIMLWVVPP